MSTLATLGGYLGSAISGGFVLKLLDTWSARRAAKDKRTETELEGDATVKTRRIESDEHLRAELWDRITKLEEKQEQCAKENADLKVAVGNRDSAIAMLTRDVGSLRTELADAKRALTTAQQQSQAAEKMCVALRDELETLRTEALGAPPISIVR